MRHAITIVFVVVGLLMPTAAGAGERLFDGALGAASGALLFGAPGFVAGGVIGYMAGPRISRSLGFHRHYRYAYYSRRPAPCYAWTPHPHVGLRVGLLWRGLLVSQALQLYRPASVRFLLSTEGGC